MKEPEYYVPHNQAKTTFGIKILCFFNVASVGLFGYGLINLITCNTSICGFASLIGLFIPSLISSIVLLLLGIYRFNKTPKTLRWITLGLPLIPMLGVYLAPFLG